MSSLATSLSKESTRCKQTLARALDAALGCRCFWKKRLHFGQICKESPGEFQGELESHLNIFHPNQYLTQFSHQLAIRTENIDFTPHIFSRSFDHIYPSYIRRQLLLWQDLDQLLSVHGTEVLWWVGIPSRKPTYGRRKTSQTTTWMYETL